MALIITSPLRGWAAPLDSVPDPVFAERMMGDGVAIHPLDDTVCAPAQHMPGSAPPVSCPH
ncbi:MAG: hypothetical protein EOP68_25640 [Sphingomonas sp.]|nr:MAG: hypothetical protein EOP68_25640 [Sphingomonas sp.]